VYITCGQEGQLRDDFIEKFDDGKTHFISLPRYAILKTVLLH
jgi:hypothetical protein